MPKSGASSVASSSCSAGNSAGSSENGAWSKLALSSALRMSSPLHEAHATPSLIMASHTAAEGTPSGRVLEGGAAAAAVSKEAAE